MQWSVPLVLAVLLRAAVQAWSLSDINPEGACKSSIQLHCKQFLPDGARGRSLLVTASDDWKVDNLSRNTATQGRRNSAARSPVRLKGNTSAILPWLLQKYNITNLPANTTSPVAKCLRNVMMQQRLSINVGAPLSEACMHDVRSFFAAQAEDIRNDLKLMEACAPEIKGFCSRVVPGEGRVLSCLKASKPALSDRCSAMVTKRQLYSSEDISFDARLKSACNNDLEKYCKDVPWGSGGKKACLEAVLKRRGKDGKLEPACSAALYRRALEDSEDIRFDYRLADTCAADKAKFCASVLPGQARVIQCLESHMDDKSFHWACKRLLQARAMRKSRDVRLDFRFRMMCRKDVNLLCPDFTQLVTKPWLKTDLRGSDLIECMWDKMDNITSPDCREHMSMMRQRSSLNPMYDSPLQRGCAAEVKELCSDIAPSQTFMLTSCLNRKKLEGYLVSQQCSVVLMKRLVMASKDFKLNPILQRACNQEFARYCVDASTEDDSGVECLIRHRKEHDFGRRCSDALSQFAMEMTTDVRLVHSVARGCAKEIGSLCQGIEPGEGRVISCLQAKRSHITSSACRDAVLKITGLATDDWRMDYNLYTSCQQDVEKHCAGVEPGEGRVHQCLRANSDRLSPRCLMAERMMEELESEDIRVNPRLKVCTSAARRFCADVPAGDAARISCLQDHMAEDSFPTDCFHVMEDIVEKASTRFYLNPRVKRMCNNDVNRYCRWSDMKPDDPDGSILACLANRITQTESECRRELVRVVRLQLWRYRTGMPLTSPCDGDAMKHCHLGTVAAPYLQSGYISECLMRSSANLTRGCWALISLPDADGIRQAARLEAKYWHREFAQEAFNEVAGNVRQSIFGELKHHLEHITMERVKRAVGNNTPAWLLVAAMVLGGAGVVGITSWLIVFRRRGPLVIKDGRA
uniref:Golgi apparatus protein 1 n=1 Tax=Tetraselmis sp. GSL018 TaxID=582737 RepID=A0A061RAY5_9CHLO|eukprot:CAMPEP_0177590052 /NCGR_PEP_ID=MMETSP0419_2-20121207/7169_1 /TAXON_ID=582737 /ORGANISM="Tetraselmis sp., Strain GSL018" /LENGTH=919 /DNA_ID=CAMNT_0019080523 /DNA_START=535 /DNA_END=3294 /DNA_ORIENTATION=+